MVYMYAHFVFYWIEGQGTVTIAHGTIKGDNNISLPWTFNIDEVWDQENFVKYCKEWTTEHLAKFKKNHGSQ